MASLPECSDLWTNHKHVGVTIAIMHYYFVTLYVGLLPSKIFGKLLKNAPGGILNFKLMILSAV